MSDGSIAIELDTAVAAAAADDVFDPSKISAAKILELISGQLQSPVSEAEREIQGS
jgi:hypothetical protein